MIRTLAIPVLCGLAASPAALATPDPTVLGASIDKATPKNANERDPALVAKAEILLDPAHVSPGEIAWTATIFARPFARFSRSTACPSPAIWTRPPGPR